MNRNFDGPIVREMVAADAQAIISLNHSVVSVTSPLDATRFSQLFDFSTFKSVAMVNGECAGFLIGIGGGVDYENDNYRWFSNQFEDFLYIDRVVVAAGHRSLGVGSRLYAHALKEAREAELQLICAEINIEPPNQQSLRFHEKMGFTQVGTRDLLNGKRVSMQVCRVSESA